MPTCLYVSDSPRPGQARVAKLGGAGTSLLDILKELPTFDWDAHVVVPSEGQFADALRRMGISCCVYPFRSVDSRRPFSTWRGFNAWRRIIHEVRPALIHGNGFDPSRSFGPAAYSLGVPFISHVHFPAGPGGIRWVLRALPKPKAFIFNSQAMMDALWADIVRYAPASRPYVVHNAVDLASFTPAPYPEAPPYRVGIVANFAPFKRHEDFLRMAAVIVRERTDVEFWIVGDDTEGKGRHQTLARLAGDLELTPYTRFLGHRLDVAEIMAQLHVLVVTSLFEPFGRVIIEAMARGRPVVGSRDGGIPEIIKHGKTGYLVEVGDHAGFARAVLALLNDRDRWDTMSRRAVELAQERFSNADHVARIVAIYREILGRSQRSAATRSLPGLERSG